MKIIGILASVGAALIAGQAVAQSALEVAEDSGYCADRGGVESARWENEAKTELRISCKDGAAALNDGTIAGAGIALLIAIGAAAGGGSDGSSSSATSTTGTN